MRDAMGRRVGVFIPAGASLIGYDRNAVSDGNALDTGDETVVQQSFKEEVDVNTVVRRFGISGAMPSGVAGGVYGDFSGITDFEGAVEAMEKAQRGFMALPPEVREQFGNDPGRLIAFAQSVPFDQFELAVNPPKQVPAAAPAPVIPAGTQVELKPS